MNKKCFLVILLLMTNVTNGAFRFNQERNPVAREAYIRDLLRLRAALYKEEENIAFKRCIIETLDREIERNYALDKPHIYANVD